MKKQEAEITINGETRRVEITEELRKIFEFECLKVWEPKNGSRYFFIGDDGGIYANYWDDCAAVDIFRWETGNCKQTEAECEFKREKEKVETELRNFAKEHNEPLNWEDFRQEKFYLNWDYSENQIVFPSNITYKGNDIYYSSKKIAESAVKAVGEDRVKKYYLEVE